MSLLSSFIIKIASSHFGRWSCRLRPADVRLLEAEGALLADRFLTPDFFSFASLLSSFLFLKKELLLHLFLLLDIRRHNVTSDSTCKRLIQRGRHASSLASKSGPPALAKEGQQAGEPRGNHPRDRPDRHATAPVPASGPGPKKRRAGDFSSCTPRQGTPLRHPRRDHRGVVRQARTNPVAGETTRARFSPSTPSG